MLTSNYSNKKKLFLGSLVLTVILFTFSAKASDLYELISFNCEKGFGSWKYGAVERASCEFDSKIKHSGAGSVKLTGTKKAYWAGFKHSVVMAAGAELTIKAFIKTDFVDAKANTGALIQVDFFKGDINNFSDTNFVGRKRFYINKSYAAFKQIEYKFKALPEATHAYIGFNILNADGTLWFDDITIYSNQKKPEKKVARVLIKPYLQNVKQTAITVMWETGMPTTGVVKYGKTNKCSQTAVSDKLVKLHETVLKDLEPETKYFYKVYSTAPEKYEVGGGTFQTAVKPNTSFSFAVRGDTRAEGGLGGDTSKNKIIANAILAKHPNFIINTGDIVMGTKGYAEYAYEFFKPAEKLFMNVPFFIAIGDHELRFKHNPELQAKNRHWYYDFISAPSNETYYSFDYGDAHFVILNPVIKVDGGPGIGLDSKQYKWLIQDLKSSKSKWKIAFLHYPIYVSARRFLKRANEMKQFVAPVLEKYGVDMVFAGHAHHYERSLPLKNDKLAEKDGTIYITTGGGGCGLTSVDKVKGWWAAKIKLKHHYCLVNIKNNELEMKVLTPDGNVLDSLSIKKK